MMLDAESAPSGAVSPETQKILDDLRSEGNTIEGDQPAAAPLQEEAVHEEPVDKATEEIVVDRSHKEPALIPAWEHKVAEKRWLKEREALEAELQELRAKPTEENRAAVRKTADNIRELAEQHGLIIDESQEQFFKALLSRAVPEDVSLKLEALERDRQLSFLEAQFEAEFRKDVAPLLTEKYGELDAEQLVALKRKLHDTAFTETYAKVPLKKVFIAEESEFKIDRPQPKDTIKAAKSGKSRTVEIDFESVDEDAFRRMTPEEIERYTEHQIKREGGHRWR